MASRRTDDLTDEELYSRWLTHEDQGAAQLLYERHFQSVRTIFRHWGLSDEDCDDGVQEVFLRVFKSKSFSSQRKFTPWLYAIARNQANDIRKRSRKFDASAQSSK